MGRLWKLISSTYLISLYETIFRDGAKNLYKIIPIALLKSWSKHFVNDSKLWRTTKNSICNWKISNNKLVNGVEVYYQHLSKLVNYLRVKAIDVFFTTIFKVGLHSYLRLTTTNVAWYTFIKHKETIVIYEESGLIISNYNVLITHLESKPIA
jgi:hypothetical protein